ncbi:MAG: serpin family protein [Elusimicrobia bacterium]|nr:serpin family protein [Elusimicrobiota bacterium]
MMRLRTICGIAILVILAASHRVMGKMSIISYNSNQFGFELYQQLKTNDGNLFFSPFSIASALGMTYAGARGKTAQEMQKLLYSEQYKSIHSAFLNVHKQINSIQTKDTISLHTANSLWAQKDYAFLESFMKTVKKYYEAEIRLVDFKNSEKVRNTINEWVEKQTEQTIKELIKKGALNALTRMVLCNAVYFYGEWLSQFDASSTEEFEFSINSVRTVQVPMMIQNHEFRYVDFKGFAAIELPYHRGELSMVIFLPEEIDGLSKLEEDLTWDKVQKWLTELYDEQPQDVDVYIPRFKTTGEFNLSTILQSMGMKSAFSLTTADFSGMTGHKDLYISSVIHKAFIDVHEKGTEASAATGVILEKGASSFEYPEFCADHPFVFLICENKTKNILFMGRIIDPS